MTFTILYASVCYMKVISYIVWCIIPGNHSRSLKRILDTWDRNGSTSGPTPWQIWWWWWSPYTSIYSFQIFPWKILTKTHVHVSDSYSLVIFQHKMYQRRCTAKNSWWWAERLPETCRVVIPIKLEFSASVGFIHKELNERHIKQGTKWASY